MNTPDPVGATPTPARTTRVTAGTRAALAGAALAAVLTAHAGAPADPTVTVAVRVADLNLASPAGARVLYHRLATAAHQVCGRADLRELHQWALIDACYQRALADAVSSLHNQQLSALLASQLGRGTT